VADRPELPKEMTNSLEMEFVLIPAGEFLMGSPESAESLAEEFANLKAEHFEDEYPPHKVTISRPFYLGSHEVTVGQFRQFVEAEGYTTEPERDGKGGSGWNEIENQFEADPKYNWRNTGFEQTDDHPVMHVTWNDAVAFCEWLTRRERREYRLPTEAEWEYACRAGSTTRWWFGNDAERLAQVANVRDATAHAKYGWEWGIRGLDGYVFTAPVGSFVANAWGLYDMHGNVYEWCADWYDEDYYRVSPALDPKGPDSSDYRVLRGGAWFNPAGCTRSAFRVPKAPNDRGLSGGFRLAWTP
jgi:formylglycine-generating enzyme required for sulfatase activity